MVATTTAIGAVMVDGTAGIAGAAGGRISTSRPRGRTTAHHGIAGACLTPIGHGGAGNQRELGQLGWPFFFISLPQEHPRESR